MTGRGRPNDEVFSGFDDAAQLGRGTAEGALRRNALFDLKRQLLIGFLRYFGADSLLHQRVAVRHIRQTHLNGRLPIENGQAPLQGQPNRVGQLRFPFLDVPSIAGVQDAAGHALLNGFGEQFREPRPFQFTVPFEAVFRHRIRKPNHIVDQNHNAIGRTLDQQSEPLPLLNQVKFNPLAV